MDPRGWLGVGTDSRVAAWQAGFKVQVDDGSPAGARGVRLRGASGSVGMRRHQRTDFGEILGKSCLFVCRARSDSASHSEATHRQVLHVPTWRVCYVGLLSGELKRTRSVMCARGPFTADSVQTRHFAD